MANGETITGIFEKNDICDFGHCSKVNLYDGVIILMLIEMVLVDP